MNLFNIVTQYRAIFNDDEHSPLMSIKSGTVNQNVIFFNWLNDKVINTILYFAKCTNCLNVLSLDNAVSKHIRRRFKPRSVIS